MMAQARGSKAVCKYIGNEPFSSFPEQSQMSQLASTLVLVGGIILLVLLLLPLAAYFIALALSPTSALFPRPLREAKEILLVVAHPDDECESKLFC
jgi:hypothetical protein